MKTGIEELRSAVRLFNDVREDWNDQYTAEQLISIARAMRASKWDIYPDQWEERQVSEALQGTVPDWEEDDNGEVIPKY